MEKRGTHALICCFVHFQLQTMFAQLKVILDSQSFVRNKDVDLKLKQQSAKISVLKRKVCQLEATVGGYSFFRSLHWKFYFQLFSLLILSLSFDFSEFEEGADNGYD